MRCEQFRELISAYIERSIAPPLAAKMDEHAAQCESCRAEREDVERLWRLMASAERVEPPVSLHARIMQELDRRTAAPPLRWWELAWRPRFAFAAAAALMLVALAVWWRHEPSQESIALSVVPSQEPTIARPNDGEVSVRFEALTTDSGRTRWVLRLQTAQPFSGRVVVNEQEVWQGIVSGEASLILPESPHRPLALRVEGTKGNHIYAWLPTSVAREVPRVAIQWQEASIEETMRRIAQTYGVPIVVAGQPDPLTRVSIESQGVTLDELCRALADRLGLRVSRLSDGSTVFAAR